MKYILLLLLTCNILLAQFELQKEYMFRDDTIVSTDIFPNTKAFTLFHITPKKMSFRIKSKELIKKFHKHHIEVSAKASIISFKRVFSFDMQALHVSIKNYYKKHYKDIQILSLHVRPKSYITKLPKNYSIHIPPKNFHRTEGIFYLKTDTKNKLFFSYILEAKIPVIVSKNLIARKESVTPFNTRREIVDFKGFKSPPLSQITLRNHWCANIRLKKGRILTKRDVKITPLVKRNQNVVAIIKTGSLEVELSAKAQNDGALYDMITIKKSNGEKLKAKVIGANRVEIQ